MVHPGKPQQLRLGLAMHAVREACWPCTSTAAGVADTSMMKGAALLLCATQSCVAGRTIGVSLSLSPAIARTGARIARSQLSYSLAFLKRDSACKWNALQASDHQ